jgi:hypothetical protein
MANAYYLFPFHLQILLIVCVYLCCAGGDSCVYFVCWRGSKEGEVFD